MFISSMAMSILPSGVLLHLRHIENFEGHGTGYSVCLVAIRCQTLEIYGASVMVFLNVYVKMTEICLVEYQSLDALLCQ
jgi:hypothetical protein